MLNKIPMIWKVALFLFVAGGLVITILGSLGQCVQTYECKPLMDSTVGRMIGADKHIALSVERLNEDIPLDMRHYYRNEILVAFLGLLVSIYLVYYLISRFFMPKDMPLLSKFAVFCGVLCIAYVLAIGYNWLYDGGIGVYNIPGTGIWNLIKNLDVFYSPSSVATLQNVV